MYEDSCAGNTHYCELYSSRNPGRSFCALTYAADIISLTAERYSCWNILDILYSQTYPPLKTKSNTLET